MKKQLTGAEMIDKERKEQLEKHGFSVRQDARYLRDELVKGALFAINPQIFEWPKGWDSGFMKTIQEKKLSERLAIAGAFLAAKIDVIEYLKKEKRKK